MLDQRLRSYIDPPLKGWARFFVRIGFTADGMTLLGFAFGIAAAVAVSQEHYGTGFVLVVLNRIADGLDGPIARERGGGSDFGGFLDIVCDFLFYNAMVVGFALAQPDARAAALFLMLSFVGTGSSFLAYAIVAAKRGETHERQGKKSFYYLGGLTEGTETIAFLLVCCAFPGIFLWAAWVFAGLCLLTTLGRIAIARRQFS